MAKVAAKKNTEALAIAVANAIQTEGWRVESQTTTQAVLVKGKNVNHILHTVLDILTAGIWLLVHVPVWAVNRRQVRILRVDELGNVLAAN